MIDHQSFRIPLARVKILKLEHAFGVRERLTDQLALLRVNLHSRILFRFQRKQVMHEYHQFIILPVRQDSHIGIEHDFGAVLIFSIRGGDTIHPLFVRRKQIIHIQ